MNAARVAIRSRTILCGLQSSGSKAIINRQAADIAVVDEGNDSQVKPKAVPPILEIDLVAD